jgi:hypothetical protein
LQFLRSGKIDDFFGSREVSGLDDLMLLGDKIIKYKPPAEKDTRTKP